MVGKGFCRDCLTQGAAARCAHCGSPRMIAHAELHALSIAHIDCDAFYASVEKRDDPTLRDRPVIVGGGRRGVVSAACYVARTYGVHSAMPMFKALKACPKATVIRPSMKKYAAVAKEIRAVLRSATPLVEPLSLDEAFLDLTGTDRLHRHSPAETLAGLVRRIEDEIGVTASIGLSYNKFLAKVASDLDKPRGFFIIGRGEAVDFLDRQPVSIIWGAGQALQRRLAKDGITKVGQLRQMDEADLVARYGAMGRRMALFSHGQDNRRITPNAPAKSISSETTFNEDKAELSSLERVLWRQAERVAERLKANDLAGEVVTLKLRTSDFKILTRASKMANPTQLADVIFARAQPLLEREADGRRFRLLGVGVSDLVDGSQADPVDLGDPDAGRRAGAERAMDKIKQRFGGEAILKGRAGLKRPE